MQKMFSIVIPASLISLIMIPLILFTQYSSAIVSNTALSQAQQIRADSQDLALASACGHAGSLNWCFGTAPDEVDTEYLRTCFINAGCNATEAVVEADWAWRMLNDKSVADLRARLIREEVGEEAADMRLAALARRADSSSTTATTTSETSTSATDSTTSTTSESSTSTTDSTTSTTTTSGSTTASTTSSTAASSTTATSTTNTTGTSLTCSTTSYLTTSYCPTQSTGTDAGSTLSCYQTVEPTMTCAAGLLCLTNSDTGSEGCMVPEGLGTSGIAVFLYFGIVVGVGIFGLCVASFRESARDKKLRAQWELAAATKAAESEAKTGRARGHLSRRGSAVNLLSGPAS